ncbi:MAG TPA: bifunctional 5,10-methylenetetrahydrofolate dehydrogenase/5,10-methenyltetrahydrofolate cyclohydrolase [Candidatus Paceibacterota bacterium]
MIIDGRKIANGIAETLNGRGKTLYVLQVGDESASTSYIKIKQKFGEKIGVKIIREQLSPNTQSSELILKIKEANQDKNISGIIVQLPLPEHIVTALVLAEISPTKDPDALSPSPLVLPPVVAAVEEIVNRYEIDLYFSDVVVVGYGQLVGQPVTKWLRDAGVEFALVTEENENPEKILQGADVIISGVGKPSLIKPDMIKSGVIIIDAGTSESGGALMGDVDPKCAQKASLLTPVPGGLGPITVAKLFQNLISLAKL